MIADDIDAQLTYAQVLAEEGRLREARAALRALGDHPVARDWLDRLDRGEPLTLDDRFTFEAGLPQVPHGRVFFALMMVGLLVYPFLSILFPTPTPNLQSQAVPTVDSTSADSLARLQAFCVDEVRIAIASGAVDEPISCLDWTLRLPTAQRDTALECHLGYAREFEYEDCLLDAGISP